MPNKSYLKGVRFECEIVKELRKVDVPLCCKKEIWVKRSRQGWEVVEV